MWMIRCFAKYGCSQKQGTGQRPYFGLFLSAFWSYRFIYISFQFIMHSIFHYIRNIFLHMAFFRWQRFVAFLFWYSKVTFRFVFRIWILKCTLCGTKQHIVSAQSGGTLEIGHATATTVHCAPPSLQRNAAAWNGSRIATSQRHFCIHDFWYPTVFDVVAFVDGRRKGIWFSFLKKNLFQYMF